MLGKHRQLLHWYTLRTVYFCAYDGDFSCVYDVCACCIYVSIWSSPPPSSWVTCTVSTSPPGYHPDLCKTRMKKKKKMSLKRQITITSLTLDWQLISLPPLPPLYNVHTVRGWSTLSLGTLNLRGDTVATVALTARPRTMYKSWFIHVHAGAGPQQKS